MRKGLLAVALCALVWSARAEAAPTLVLDDPLTAPLGSGQTVTGGTFSAAGWTRDGFDSQIIYDLGQPITAGRLTFEMDGVNGVDHGVGGFPDCRAIFAAVDNNASGNIDDPGNESVQFLWAWAMEETDYCNGGPGGFERTDRMKLLVHTGAASEPGEPMSDPLSWDITTFYGYEIGWDANHAWLLRDGATVLDQQYPSAPVVMNLRYVFLGTVNRYKAGVKNATYRNLKLWDDGGPTTGDAGTDGGGSCLSAGPLSPANGSGSAAVLQVPYTHCEGASAFRVVQIWVGDQVQNGVPAVSAGYEAGMLSLDGSSDTCTPGEAKTLSSSYGSLDCATTTAQSSGDTLTVSWSLAFDSAFTGAHSVFVDAKGGSGTPEPRLGWTELGSFTVGTAPSPDAGQADAGKDAGFSSHGSTEPADSDSGCGCRVPRGAPRLPVPGLLLVVGLACARRAGRRARTGHARRAALSWRP
jgi:hypothetical protein